MGSKAENCLMYSNKRRPVWSELSKRGTGYAGVKASILPIRYIGHGFTTLKGWRLPISFLPLFSTQIIAPFHDTVFKCKERGAPDSGPTL